MQFEINGVRRSPGVFHVFDTFRDFRSWLCRAFGLGDQFLATLHFYKDGCWRSCSPSLSVPFETCPFYCVHRTGHDIVYVRRVSHAHHLASSAAMRQKNKPQTGLADCSRLLSH